MRLTNAFRFEILPISLNIPKVYVRYKSIRKGLWMRFNSLEANIFSLPIQKQRSFTYTSSFIFFLCFRVRVFTFYLSFAIWTFGMCFLLCVFIYLFSVVLCALSFFFRFLFFAMASHILSLLDLLHGICVFLNTRR